MGQKAWKEEIIKDQAEIIEMRFHEDKDDSDFDPKAFIKTVWSDQRVHFHHHPSSYITAVCKGMSHEETDEMFQEVFTAGWKMFAKKISA